MCQKNVSYDENVYSLIAKPHRNTQKPRKTIVQTKSNNERKRQQPPNEKKQLNEITSTANILSNLFSTS